MKCSRLFVPVALMASAVSAQDLAFQKPDPKEASVRVQLDRDGYGIVAGMNRFSFDLYHSVAGERGDLAISPASVSTAFGLAYAGAKGRTAEDISTVLHYPAAADFHTTFGAVLRTMELHQNGRTLTVNNAIWLQDGLAVRPDYVTLVERNYGAGLQRVNFRGDSERARSTINRWVESKTNDRIRNLLSPANVTPKTRSVLVNAVYFKSDWSIPFDKAATKSDRFTLASGKTVMRPLMNRKGDVQFAEHDGVKALALPYRGGETEMLFLLPNRADGLRALEGSLTAAALAEWVARLDQGFPQVIVSIPRFKIENRFELADDLKSLGMITPFSNDSDFSAMKVVDPASANREDWNLKIDNVVHQVFVEVEEKGTEAAAAAAITTILITGTRAVREPKVFRADHPFLFLIRDRRTGAILFIGRYSGENA